MNATPHTRALLAQPGRSEVEPSQPPADHPTPACGGSHPVNLLADISRILGEPAPENGIADEAKADRLASLRAALASLRLARLSLDGLRNHLSDATAEIATQIECEEEPL